MMRRTTLGPLTKDANNVRLSMGGAPMRAIPGYSALKAQPTRRASAVPTLGGGGRRPSTIRGNNNKPRYASTSFNNGSRMSMAVGGGRGRHKDPRPLTDRQYIQQSVKGLIEFVIARGYDHPISLKVMTSPTSRDFLNIFTFLVQRIDPTFAFEKRFEEVIPVLMKGFGYRFTISKSALSAVGSPHTWPALLGCLSWLRELIIYHEKARELADEQSALDVEAKRERQFNDDLDEAYRQFLNGADAHPELDQALQDAFQEQNVLLQQETENLAEEKKQLEMTVTALNSQPTPLAQIKDHQQALESNIKKFNQLIPSLVDHRAAIEKSIEKNTKELADLRAETDEIISEKVQIQEVVERQQQNAIDVELIAKDRANLNEALAKVAAEKASMERERSIADQKIVEATTRVNDALKVYHKHAEDLELIPATAKNANGADFSIVLTRDASRTNADEMLSLDVNKAVLPSIKELKEAYVQRMQALRTDEFSLKEKNFALEEELLLLRNGLSELELRRDALEKEYESEKNNMAEVLKEQAERKAAHDADMADLRRKNEEIVRESASRLRTTRDQLRQWETQIAEEKSRIACRIIESMRVLQSHHLQAKEKLLEVKRCFDEFTCQTNEEEDALSEELGKLSMKQNSQM